MALAKDRITLVWLLLVAATLISFETTFIPSKTVAGAVVIVIAFAKVVVVGREFMELREAPRVLLWLFQGWAALVCIALLVLLVLTGAAKA